MAKISILSQLSAYRESKTTVEGRREWPLFSRIKFRDFPLIFQAIFRYFFLLFLSKGAFAKERYRTYFKRILLQRNNVLEKWLIFSQHHNFNLRRQTTRVKFLDLSRFSLSFLDVAHLQGVIVFPFQTKNIP